MSRNLPGATEADVGGRTDRGDDPAPDSDDGEARPGGLRPNSVCGLRGCARGRVAQFPQRQQPLRRTNQDHRDGATEEGDPHDRHPYTPINNGVFDLYNQVSLFTRGDERYFARAGIPYLRRYFIEAVENGDLLNLMEEVTVRRTRRFVASNYPDAEIDGQRIHFPKRRPLKTERYNLEKANKGLYEKVASGIEGLNLVSYNREALVREKGRRESEAVQRNEALIAIMKVGLLKRFESSVAAFRKSVESQLAFQRDFLSALEKGRILDSATHRRALALDAGTNVRDLLEDLPVVSAEDYDEDAFVALVEEDIVTLEDLRGAVKDIDEEEDDKFWQLAYLLDERPKGAKTLVFTTYKDTAEYLAEAFREHPDLDMEGRRWEVLHGGIKPETRTNVVERFAPQASKRPELIGSPDEVDVLISTDVL